MAEIQKNLVCHLISPKSLCAGYRDNGVLIRQVGIFMKNLSIIKDGITIILFFIFMIVISLYIYHGYIFKIRPYPECADLSLSGCYMTEIYYISWKDSAFLNIIYNQPVFVKVFDVKTKKCTYTSRIYTADELSPLIQTKYATTYGALSIRTECTK